VLLCAECYENVYKAYKLSVVHGVEGQGLARPKGVSYHFLFSPFALPKSRFSDGLDSTPSKAIHFSVLQTRIWVPGDVSWG
jgi:hypothetical protein